jgi:hypothetical protein
MKKDFDYKDVPQGYLHCLHAGCPRSADCLRFKVGAAVHEDIPYFSILNPAYVTKQKECNFFQPDELVRCAYGISHLYDNLLHKQYLKIKKIIHDYLGHSHYYRVRNKLLPIKPEEQAFIRELFIKEGIETEPLFDEYVEHYDFSFSGE